MCISASTGHKFYLHSWYLIKMLKGLSNILRPAMIFSTQLEKKGNQKPWICLLWISSFKSHHHQFIKSPEVNFRWRLQIEALKTVEFQWFLAVFILASNLPDLVVLGLTQTLTSTTQPAKPGGISGLNFSREASRIPSCSLSSVRNFPNLWQCLLSHWQRNSSGKWVFVVVHGRWGWNIYDLIDLYTVIMIRELVSCQMLSTDWRSGWFYPCVRKLGHSCLPQKLTEPANLQKAFKEAGRDGYNRFLYECCFVDALRQFNRSK